MEGTKRKPAWGADGGQTIQGIVDFLTNFCLYPKSKCIKNAKGKSEVCYLIRFAFLQCEEQCGDAGMQNKCKLICGKLLIQSGQWR